VRSRGPLAALRGDIERAVPLSAGKYNKSLTESARRRVKELEARANELGDDVLRFVANYLTACVRESDYVFRWGGDEFLIVLPKTDAASAGAKAEELVRRLPNIPGTDNLQPTLSVGSATHRIDVDFPVTLAEADSRMYQMKLVRKRERAERERDRELLGEADRRFEPAGPSRS